MSRTSGALDGDFAHGPTQPVPDAFSQPPDTREHDSSDGKVEALVDIMCRAGDEPETKSAALLVLLATIEDSTHPKALTNKAKHLAFTRCGELNLYGMVEAQVATIEDELFAVVV